jgi:hypothetical protein
MQPMNFTAAEDLCQRGFARLSRGVTPASRRSGQMTADTFRAEIVLVLEPLGHTVISNATTSARPRAQMGLII